MHLIQPREIEEVTSLILKHRDSKICLVDDIDCDGLSSLIIMYRTLERLGYNVSIRYNTKHGITGEELVEFKEYDLLILLDSSTNECDNYSSFKGDILIIDHHEIKSGLRPSSITLLCNSKNTNGLENISAGFLTYSICKFLGDKMSIDTSDLAAYGIMSIYSDIVPVDPYVKNIIDYNMSTNFETDLLRYSKYNQRLTRTAYQMDIVPKFNYTRRLGDLITIDKVVALGYRDVTHAKLADNRMKAKEIVNVLSLSKVPTSLYHEGNETLRYLDISDAKNILTNIPIANFKGLLCNREKGIHELNSVVCGINDGEGNISISIRSDSEVLKVAEKFFITGGGHYKACGGVVKQENLGAMLKELSKLEPSNKDEIVDMDWSNLEKDILLQYAIYNEYAFSNITPYTIRLPYNRIIEMPSIEHNVGGIKIKKFQNIPIDKPIVMTPTLVGGIDGGLEVSLIVNN